MDCPRLNGWRRGLGKPQPGWNWNWEGCEDQSTSFCTQPSAKGRLREMWAHPTYEQGMCWLVISAFSVSFCFFLLNSALSSASEPSGRAWESEELPTVEKDQDWWLLGQLDIPKSDGPGRLHRRWGEADRGHCEAPHCHLQRGSQWQERGKHCSQPQEGQGRGSRGGYAADPPGNHFQTQRSRRWFVTASMELPWARWPLGLPSLMGCLAMWVRGEQVMLPTPDFSKASDLVFHSFHPERSVKYELD